MMKDLPTISPEELDARDEGKEPRRVLLPGEKRLVSPGKQQDGVKIARFVILWCDGDEPDPDPSEWRVVHPDHVPEWLRDPDTMGQLADEETVAQNLEYGPGWYRAVRQRIELAS